MPLTVTIAVETPLQDDVRTLVEALNQALLALTPREFCHHLTVEQMAHADTSLFVARDSDLPAPSGHGGQAVAMGALKRHGGGTGEVKRLYTLPSRQGRGLGGQILRHIEDTARAEGLTKLVLETGNNFGAALRLYDRQGFTECGPVLDYPPTPFTAFYEKALRMDVPA